MAEMHRIDTTGIARALPARGKQPTIVDMSVAWSRSGVWTGPLHAPAPPRTNPAVVGGSRSVANRTHVPTAQEYAKVMNAHSRVLHKIASHRLKSVQAAARAAEFAHTMPPRPLNRASQLPGKRALTPRELEVLRLVARGETDRGIAERLYVSRRTVSCHVSNILDKLDVESRRKAVLIAMRIGLL